MRSALITAGCAVSSTVLGCLQLTPGNLGAGLLLFVGGAGFFIAMRDYERHLDRQLAELEADKERNDGR